MLGPVSTRIDNRVRASKPSRCIGAEPATQVYSAWPSLRGWGAMINSESWGSKQAPQRDALAHVHGIAVLAGGV